MNKVTGAYSVDIPRDLDKMRRSYEAILEARQQYPEIEIKFGVEVENNPRCYPQMEEILNTLEFDFVIGSVHLVQGVPVTASMQKPFLAKQEPNRFYQQYYEEMARFVEWGRFDVLGHADIIRRYMVELHPGFKPLLPYDVLRNVFTLLRNRGQGLEINTGGLFEAPQETYPTPELLNLALDCGIERFTLGSDAHKPENLGRGFGRIADLFNNN